MKKLINGILDFKQKMSQEYKETFARLALGQAPDALFVTCSDSRVAPNLFASTDPGDLFVLRNVGNLIPPCCATEGRAAGCESAAATVEFAVINLNVSSIIVCGHSECGAMQSLVQDCKNVTSPNLKAWLQHGQVAKEKLAQAPKSNLKPYNKLSQLNVLEQLNHLRSYPEISKRIEEGKLKIYGWWFDIATTEIYSYNEEKNQFVLLDDTEAERIKKNLR